MKTVSPSQEQDLFQTQNKGSHHGTSLRIYNGSWLYVQQPDAVVIAGTVAVNSGKNFLGWSRDEAGGAGASAFYINGDTETFDSSGSTSTTAATINAHLFGDTYYAVIGTFVEAVIAYNRALSKAKMDQIYNHFNNQGRV